MTRRYCNTLSFSEVYRFVILSFSFLLFSFRPVRSRAVHMTMRSIYTNLKLPPRNAPSVGFRTVSCRTSYFYLTPITLFCVIISFTRGPGRIQTVSTKSRSIRRRSFVPSNTTSHIRSLGLLPTVTTVYSCRRQSFVFLSSFLSFFPFLLFSFACLPCHKTLGIHIDSVLPS